MVARADGQYLGHFTGFGDTRDFVRELDAALADLATVEERTARFATKPTLGDARMLARYHEGSDAYAEADRYYAQALALAPADGEARKELLQERAWMRLRAARGQKLPAPDVVAGVREALPAVDASLGAYMALTLAESVKDPAVEAEVLALVEEAHGRSATDEQAADAHRRLGVVHALRVLKDPARAVELKRATLGDDWEKDWNKLNEFAWWCFEQRLNLDEAAALATTAADLAPKGSDRANVLDTLAEIRNAQGRRDEAIATEQKALAEDPGRAEFEKKLAEWKAAD